LYLSGHLLSLGRRFCADDGPDAEPRLAVVMAAIALEGFMNELEDQAATDSFGPSPNAANLAIALEAIEEGRGSLLTKITIAHLALTGSMPDKGSQPLQDIALLMKLRNLLVHARPEVVELGEVGTTKEQPRIVRACVSRGLIPMPPVGSPVAWQQFVLVPAVARWAFNTGVRGMGWIVGLVPEGPLRELLGLRIEFLKELA
jgi:hypothetical protein